MAYPERVQTGYLDFSDIGIAHVTDDTHGRYNVVPAILIFSILIAFRICMRQQPGVNQTYP